MRNRLLVKAFINLLNVLHNYKSNMKLKYLVVNNLSFVADSVILVTCFVHLYSCVLR
jgi:hypothetical protein